MQDGRPVRRFRAGQQFFSDGHFALRTLPHAEISISGLDGRHGSSEIKRDFEPGADVDLGVITLTGPLGRYLSLHH
jgi:hypothetical protein